MRTVIPISVCVLVCLALAGVASRYMPSHWILSVFHNLHLNLALASTLAMVFVLVLKRHAVTWLLFAAALALSVHGLLMSREFAADQAPVESDAPVIRLMSFNILGSNIANGAAIARTVMSSGADIVMIMEAVPLRPHLDELATIYPHRVGCGVIARVCDQLLLSRYPIEAPSVRSLSSVIPERFYLGRVTIAGRTITLGAIHTTKPYFDRFHIRELDQARRAINAVEGPLVLAGDFNATSISPTMRMFLEATGLRHAAREPATWPIEAGPFGIAIDHVYARAPLKVASIRRLPDAQGSNHYGLMAELVFTAE